VAHYDSRRYALINRWDPSHLERVDRLLELNDGLKVLEVGCGQGHLTKRLAARGLDITGIDANPNAPVVAETARVLHMHGEDLSFEDESFDVIVSIHAIEHIPALEEAIAEMGRVLKTGGRAMHVYPAEPIMGLYAIPTSVILYGTPFRAREVHCHKLWPAKLRRLMAPHGLVETHSEFSIFKSPQFVSVFEKTG
jgi:SAM-dependent methyltransferase